MFSGNKEKCVIYIDIIPVDHILYNRKIILTLEVISMKNKGEEINCSYAEKSFVD